MGYNRYIRSCVSPQVAHRQYLQIRLEYEEDLVSAAYFLIAPALLALLPKASKRSSSSSLESGSATCALEGWGAWTACLPPFLTRRLDGLELVPHVEGY